MCKEPCSPARRPRCRVRGWFPRRLAGAGLASACARLAPAWRAPGRARRLSADTPVLLSSACIGAQDPYCGWDVAMKKCTSLEESLSMTQWEQTISACPVSGRVLGPQSAPSRESRCWAVTPRVGTASTRGHGPPSPAHPVCAHSAQAALSLEESHLDAGMSSGSV